MVFIAILVSITEITFGQVTTLTTVRPNQIPTPTFLGWDGSGVNAGTLEIRNDFSQPINFSTNTTQKMSLTSSGNLGLSDSWGSFTPGNLLHLYKSGTTASLYTQWQNGNTTHANGLKLGINGANDGEINMVDARSLNFYTNNNLAMTILGAPISGIGYAGNISIGNTGYFAKFDVADFTSSTTTLSTGYFTSTNPNTTAVVKSILNVDAVTLANPVIYGVTLIPAMHGASMHEDDNEDLSGLGGFFEGGFVGACGLATATLPGQIGLLGESRNATGSNTGVVGIATNIASSANDPMQNAGVLGRASGSMKSNVGVKAYSDTPQSLPYFRLLINSGLHARADGSLWENRVGTFITEGTIGRLNAAVWGRTTPGPADSHPGWGDTLSFFAGYFLGNVYHAGTLWGPSDIILKDSIEDLTGSLDILSMLQPKSFIYKTDSFPYMNLPQGPYHHMGLIAQQVDSILPGIVKTIPNSEIRDTNENTLNDSMYFKAINYSALIPLLISGINELNTATVTTCEPTTPTNYIPKWNDTTKTLCNSNIYDNGDNVGINTTTPLATLDVNGTGQSVGIYGYAEDTDSSTVTVGILGEAANATVSNVGVLGKAESFSINSDTIVNYGVIGICGNSGFGNAGVAGYSERSSSTSVNAGVVSRAANSDYMNFGGIFEADNTSGLNFGIYARTDSNATDRFLAGYFQGNVVVTGTMLPPADVAFADSATDISDALSSLAQLQPKNFVFKTGDYPYMNFPSGPQMGLLAQQVDSVLPSIVHTVTNPEIIDTNFEVLMDSLSFKAINYTSLIPLLVSAVNEISDTMVTTCEPSTLTDRIPKWHNATKMLCNSRIIDDGARVGVNSVNTASAFTVTTETDTIAIQGAGLAFGVRGICSGGDYDGQAGVLGIGDAETGLNVGVLGITETDNDTVENIAVMGRAANSHLLNAGVVGVAELVDDGPEGDTLIHIGIVGIASGSPYENAGGFFYIADDTIGKNYAIMAKASESDTSDHAAYLDGKVTITGILYNPSDQKLKKDIENIDSALDLLTQLEPKRYEYKREEYSSMSLPGGVQYGLLADELEEIIPELVTDITHPAYRDIEGNLISPQMQYKGINYIGLIPLLIDAIKTQQEQLDAVNERLTAVEGPQHRLDGSGNNGSDSINRITVELSSMQVIVLDQNVPNPFAEQTTISYFIPEELTTVNGQPATVSKAQIIFFDMSGRVIKTADIEKGQGIITVYAPNLSSGTYSYSLLIDGKSIQTKRMVKTK